MTRAPLRLVVALALVLLSLPAFATTYYVAIDGSNGNPGSAAQPWRSLQYAADHIAGGDTIVVRGGNYAGVQFGPAASGSPGNPTVLKAWPGETPKIISDGGHGAGINLEGVSWMVVEGFTVNDRSRVGIRAVGGAQWGLSCAHVTVRNNHLEHNGTWGIFTAFCADLLIEDNVAARSQGQHGIYVSNSGDSPVVRGNSVWGNQDSGIQLNGDASAGGDGIISDAVVAGNFVFDNGVGGGSAINLDGVQDSIIRNNLIVGNHASGISLFRTDGGGSSTGNRVLNNTVIMAPGSRWALNIQDGSSHNTVRNNILWNLGSYRGSISVSADSLPGLEADYNVVMNRFSTDGGNTILGLAQWRALGHGAHSLVAGPASLFVDASGGDYRLVAASPAIDVGGFLTDVDFDIVGSPRPAGAGFDIGAYEYRAGGDAIFRNGFE